MFKVTKKIEISLIILKHIQLNNRDVTNLLTAREISETYKISENFVAKIMQLLGRQKILASKQGVQGGYYLDVNLSQLTLLDLIEKIEGEFNIVNCFKSGEKCDYKTGCSIVDPMRHLNNKFKDFYRSIPIDEILKITINEEVIGDKAIFDSI